MFDWSDDNGALVAPHPSTKAPPCNTRAEERSNRGEGVPKQLAKGVLEQPAKEVFEQQARGVLEW